MSTTAKEYTPQIRDQIEGEHLGKAPIVYPRHDTSKPKEDANVRQDDKIMLVRGKHGRIRVEICPIGQNETRVRISRAMLTVTPGGVSTLTRSIPEKVGRPPDQLCNENKSAIRKMRKWPKGTNTDKIPCTGKSRTERWIPQCFPEFFAYFRGYVASERVLAFGVEGRKS
jgi:hypothetical protein